VSDINTAVVDSLKVLDPKRPIREADIGPGSPASMTLGNMRANGVRTLAAWCLKHDFDGPEG